MTAKTEAAKFISLISAGGSVWVGLIAVLGGFGLSPIWASSLIFGSGLLTGYSVKTFTALDEISTLESEKDALKTELDLVIEKRTQKEDELKQELAKIEAQCLDYRNQLETSVSELNARCSELQLGLNYWASFPPEILESAPVKQLVDTLKNNLRITGDELKTARAEIEELESLNEALEERIAELEEVNDRLDSELAEKTLNLDKLETNFNYKLQLELQSKIAPYTQKAIANALHEKTQEIESLNRVIDLLNQQVEEKQAILDAINTDTLPKIETTYNQEMNARDREMLKLSGENDLLKERIAELEAPHCFPGTTYPDTTGNRIIKHFLAYGVIFDALDTDLIEGGYRLRFRVNRNEDQTKLSAEHFNKVKNELGLMGLSTGDLDFKIDQRNLFVTVDIYPAYSGAIAPRGQKSDSSPGHRSDIGRTSVGHQSDINRPSLSTVGGLLTSTLDSIKTGKPKQSKVNLQKAIGLVPDIHRQKFIDLNCYPADQFEEVVRLKFVNRVRVCAGSTGGKSPLLEMIAVVLAKLNHGVLSLINPIPGSPKDWFRVPGVIQPGMDAEAAIIEAVEGFHQEFKDRRNNLIEANKKDYVVMALDEDNSTARDYERLGEFFKDMYQLSDHANMGFCSAGQGINVSGLSGGARPKPKKSKEGEETTASTGNATRLMKEDFLNCTLVLTSEQAKAYLTKHTQGTINKAEMLEKLQKLEDLCESLNESEGLTARPKIGEPKKVDPHAYRVALVVSPAYPPFFIQIPPYSYFDLDGVRFPEGARVTSVHWQEEEEDGDRVDEAFVMCPKCDCTAVKKLDPYSDGSLRFRCTRTACRKTFKVEG